MPRYSYRCPVCGAKTEVVRSMKELYRPWRCTCLADMERDFQAEGVRVGKGNKQYSREIVSDSLAISPRQIAEHKKMFPDIKVTPEGQPVFDSYTSHEKYLERCNLQKLPGKKKRKTTPK